MDIDRGKVHQEVDKIVGQQQQQGDDGIDFVVTVVRSEVHHVRATHGPQAIVLALDRPPDWEEMEVSVEEDAEEGAATPCWYCGGSGVVDASYMDENGEPVHDGEPCPEC